MDGNASPGEAESFAQAFDRLQRNVESFILGKSEVVRLALTCMLAEGHLLIEDVPGTGKTSLARVIGRSIEGTVSRIQFTPDVLPSDVAGSDIWNAGTQKFEFYKGPVFANIVVGDEINRASPKTQSALLEVMEERRVSVNGVSHSVPRPFVVIATQNPVELDGTYPLPEAQIDRFMMKVEIGYPGHADETAMIGSRAQGMDVESVHPVCTVADIARMIDIARRVHTAEALRSYAVTIASSTRNRDTIRLGVSPRGALSVIQAAQAFAAANGRHYVTADDVQLLVPHVFGHRVLLTAAAELQGQTSASFLHDILAAVPVPQDRVGA